MDLTEISSKKLDNLKNKTIKLKVSVNCILTEEVELWKNCSTWSRSFWLLTVTLTYSIANILSLINDYHRIETWKFRSTIQYSVKHCTILADHYHQESKYEHTVVNLCNCHYGNFFNKYLETCIVETHLGLPPAVWSISTLMHCRPFQSILMVENCLALSAVVFIKLNFKAFYVILRVFWWLKIGSFRLRRF